MLHTKAFIFNSTFRNNTAAGNGGALYAYKSAQVLVVQSLFDQPISHGRDSVSRDNDQTNISFSCGPGSAGSMVPMQGKEITVIPPKALKCEPPTPPPAP